MQPIITVENLTKRYKNSDKNAVDGISFTVAPGEFFCLLGPNGAGKTTTISILTTTLAPTSGEACIVGYDVLRQASDVRRNVGIIFQNPSLDLNLTAEENVRFHAVLYGLYPFVPSYAMMPRAYRDRVQGLAEVLGIEKEMFKPIKTFSQGMRRKLEIIRSLIHQPKVLFLDEPTIGLDPLSRRNLWDYICRIREDRGTTVFLTTHYLDETEEADKICMIDHGKIVSYGTPAQFKADLIEEYLLLDADDHAALRAELMRLNLTYADESPFKVSLNGRRVQEIIKAIDLPLTLLQTHSPSMEDAYLEILRKEEE